MVSFSIRTTQFSSILLFVLFFACVVFPVSAHARSEENVQVTPEDQCGEGMRLYSDEQLDEAIPLLRAGFDAGIATSGSNSLERMDCGLYLGEAYIETGQPEQAHLIFTQIFPIIEQLVERKNVAYVHMRVGHTYRDYGYFEDALAHYELALSRVQQSNEQYEAGTILNNIGSVYLLQERPDKALPTLNEALTLRRNADDDEGIATTLTNLGVVYDSLERYSDARTAYLEAKSIWLQNGDRMNAIETLRKMSDSYLLQRRMSEALDTANEALKLQQDNGGQTLGDTFEEASLLQFIGTVYRNQGNHEKALEYYGNAFDVIAKIGPSIESTRIQRDIGDMYLVQQRYQEALEIYEDAFNWFNYFGDREGKANTYIYMAAANIELGKRNQAEIYYNDAISIFNEIEAPQQEMSVLSSLGNLHADAKEYDEAINYFSRAVTLATEIGEDSAEAYIRKARADAYYEQQKYEEALREYLAAMQINEDLRSSVAGDDPLVVGFSQQSNIYDRAVSLYLTQHDPITSDDITSAFLITERGRARAFLDSLGNAPIQSASQETTQLLMNERNTYAIRRTLREQLGRERTSRKPDNQLVATLEKQLADVERAYDGIVGQIQSSDERLEQLIPRRSTEALMSIQDIQANIAPQTTLVSYWVSDERVYIFVITQEDISVEIVDVDQDELVEQVTLLRDFARDKDPLPKGSLTLYTWLIEPIVSKITTRHITIIPHNSLHYVPFAVLSDGENFLIDQHTLSVLPSANTFPFIKSHTGDDTLVDSAVVLGAPTSSTPLLPLPFAAKEANTIGALYGISPALGMEASETYLREHVADAGVIHIAAHALYVSKAPLESVIYLSEDPSSVSSDEASPNDGTLTVDEIYGLNLSQTNLVVLSACETQLGDYANGDELVSLNRAFMFAGSPSVLATLWTVTDRPTSLLMEHFHKQLKNGKSRAEALRLAQIEVRHKFPSPVYWAGFTLSGDPGTPSELETHIGILMGIVIAVIGIALVGFGLVRYRRRTSHRPVGVTIVDDFIKTPHNHG